MDKGIWRATVHAVTKSHEQLTLSLFSLPFHTFTNHSLVCPLDYKEIKPVNPKGNQPLIFIGKTDAEGEAPALDT